MKKNTYKFSVDVVFAYNIFSTDTQKNLNFTVTTDICRDNFSDAVAAFKTYVRYITHDMIELSIPDLVEKRVEGILSISYQCEQEGYFETDTNAVCVDSERIHYSRETHHDTIFESKRIATNIKWDTDGEEVDLPNQMVIPDKVHDDVKFWITLAMTEELTEEYVKKYSNPDTPEGKFKSLTDSIKNYKNVRLGLDVNGEIDSVKYPVDGIFNMDAMYDGYLDTWNIATRSEEERIEEFLEENDALLKNRDKIPFKYISDIHYGKKTVWKNPDFEN